MFNFFDVNALVSKFPDRADSTIVDTYLTDEPSASSRLFRVYYPIPRHYHETCEEHLYLLTGKVSFAIEDEAPEDLHRPQPHGGVRRDDGRHRSARDERGLRNGGGDPRHAREPL